MKKLIWVLSVVFIMALGFSSCIVHHHGYHHRHGRGWQGGYHN